MGLIEFNNAMDAKEIFGLPPNQRSQYLSALEQREHRRTMYNHFFELPLTLNASIQLESIRNVVFNSIPREQFIEELQNSQYWLKFKDFKLKAK